MIQKRAYPTLSLLLLAAHSSAGPALPLSVLPMPLEMGGVAAVAALSLIIATQLITRRK